MRGEWDMVGELRRGKAGVADSWGFALLCLWDVMNDYGKGKIAVLGS